jgi:hypothetical protein
MQHRFALRACSILAALLLGACTTVHRVNVDAIRPPDAPDEDAISYRIESGNREIEESSLRFKNAADLVRTAMLAKGMYEAPDPDMADMVVEIDFGVSDPQVHRELRSEPIYRTVITPPQIVRVAVGRTPTGAIIYEDVVIPERRDRVYDGERYYEIEYVTYEKFLEIQARAGSAAQDRPAALWSVHATTESEDRDLRKALPILAAASMDLIGTDTGGSHTIRVKEDDGSVEFIRQQGI